MKTLVLLLLLLLVVPVVLGYHPDEDTLLKEEGYPGDCSDTLDNDGDEQIDCLDVGCSLDVSCYNFFGKNAVLIKQFGVSSDIQNWFGSDVTSTGDNACQKKYIDVYCTGIIEMILGVFPIVSNNLSCSTPFNDYVNVKGFVLSEPLLATCGVAVTDFEPLPPPKSCNTSADCVGGYVCSQSVCVLSGPVVAPCQVDAHCALNEQCVAGACQKKDVVPGVGDQCQTHGDCLDNLLCGKDLTCYIDPGFSSCQNLGKDTDKDGIDDGCDVCALTDMSAGEETCALPLHQCSKTVTTCCISKIGCLVGKKGDAVQSLSKDGVLCAEKLGKLCPSPSLQTCMNGYTQVTSLESGVCCVPQDGAWDKTDFVFCENTQGFSLAGTQTLPFSGSCYDSDGDGHGVITQCSHALDKSSCVEQACTIVPTQFSDGGEPLHFYGAVGFVLTLGLLGLFYRRKV